MPLSKQPSTAVAPTRDEHGENFPVASRLIARRQRAPILAFYRFVRQADDIADAPDLAPDEKLRRLAALEAAFHARDGSEPAAKRLAEVGEEFPAVPAEALKMLGAFRQDAVKTRYADWNELVGYCALSANPVGRMLLAVHGEDETGIPFADALCTALQILNHLQDLGVDRQKLDRIYLPQPWLDQAGGETEFFAEVPSPRRRAVLDAALDAVDALIDIAEALVPALKSRHLRAESGMTVATARRLARRLRADDPILGRIALTKPDFAKALAEGVGRAIRPRSRDTAITRAKVAQSGSSFRMGMSSLSGEGKRAIHAVYAFCRVIDDIADGVAPLAEKSLFLDRWRYEIQNLGPASPTPIGRELFRATERFGLPRAELMALLDGMETDGAPQVRVADDATLDLYCRRVAGAVGVLSVHIFGVPDAYDFAVGLGRTLQLVNILRDIDEDAAIERFYVPLSRLRGADAATPAVELVRHPDFNAACLALAEEADAGFRQAEAMLRVLDRAKLKPALLMMAAYRTVFERLRARGWLSRAGGRPKLSRGDKLKLLWLAFGGGDPTPSRALPTPSRGLP